MRFSRTLAPPVVGGQFSPAIWLYRRGRKDEMNVKGRKTHGSERATDGFKTAAYRALINWLIFIKRRLRR
jgi:hypothetical protein